MRKYWWTVWIKVAVLAIVLLLAYNFVSNKVQNMLDPYLLETEPTQSVEVEEPTEEPEGNLVMQLLGKVEDILGVKIDFENMIFGYANEYAQTMKAQSEQERNPVTEPND